MRIRLGRWRLSSVVLLAGLLVSMGGLPGIAPIAVEAQSDGMRVESAATYRLDAQDGVVRVTIEATLTNTLSVRRRGFVIETPYFAEFAVPNYGPITSVTATSSSGRTLRTYVEDVGDGVEFAVVDLSPNLVPGSPQKLTLSYELAGQPNRSEAAARVNPAFANWFVFLPGDEGSNALVIDLPRSFELDSGATGTMSVTRDRRVHDFGDIPADESAFFVSARNEDALEDRTVLVDGVEIVIQAWPGDDAWATFASDAVQEGLPILMDLIGQPLPTGGVTVLEASGGYTEGYAGFYVPSERLVEVGDRLDMDTMLHELGHIWFNHELFTDRWITEGLAQELSRRALVELGEASITSEPIDVDAPGRLALTQWGRPGSGFGEDFEAQETYGYGASYRVVSELVDEIGMDGLQEVVSLATGSVIAWQGDPEPDHRRGRADWRYLYDLLDLVVEADGARDLFEEHVLTPADAALFTAREKTLEEYDALVGRGAGWSAPFVVRDELASWDFARARVLMGTATGLLDRGRQAVDLIEDVGFEDGGHLERAYETATSLSDLEDVVVAWEEVAELTADVFERRDRATGIEALGLANREGSFDAAREAIVAGDLPTSRDQLAAAAAVLDEAEVRGSLLVAAAALVVIGTLGQLGARAVGRRQRRARTLATFD